MRASESGNKVLEQPVRGGLWELLHEAYLCDVQSEVAARFGLGDWLDILYAQRRTGKLHVAGGGERFQLRFVHGSIREIAFPALNGDGWLLARDLRARAGEHIAHLVLLRHTQCRFIERATSRPGPASGCGASCLDALFRGRLRDHLRRPFLEHQIARHHNRPERSRRCGAGEPL